MIRARNKAGAHLAISPDVGFLEICDSTGKVAVAVYTDSAQLVHVVTKDSHEASRYANIFNVQFTDIVAIPASLKD